MEGYHIELKFDEMEIKDIVNQIKEVIEKSEAMKLRGGVVAKSLQVSEAKLDSSWKYFLTYYPLTGDLTITVKRFEKQPTSYAILKITDKIVEVEDFNSFIEKIAKMYIALKYLRKDLIGKEEAKEKRVRAFF